MNIASAQIRGIPFRTTVPEISEAEQLIVSVAPGWSANEVTIFLFDRASTADHWHLALPAIPAVCGRRGLAWGIGLQGGPPPGGEEKKEGDGKSPCGVFRLHEAFGSESIAELGILAFPYRQMTRFYAGVDDPESKFYNRIVDATEVHQDWKHAEAMLRPDGLYRLGVVIEHNWMPIPGFGSCTFLHIWRGPSSPTVGCTAMAESGLRALVRWIAANKNPLFVQLPIDVYRSLSSWKLPALPNLGSSK
jgi:L,D-peptidoglycan transpeptidase YkuD (ErfK/YbiS/YcfS/YnhG family)